MNTMKTFAFATDDDWEIDYHRKELIRHHKTYRRSQLFKIAGSKCPIPFDLESTRTTFIEMKNGTKKVETDDWRAVSGPEKRLDKQWRGRTVFKIKNGVKLPEELSTVKSSSKLPRISDPSDEVKPAYPLLSQAQHQLRKASRVDQVRQDLNDDLVRRQPLLLRMNMNNFSDELERGLDRAVEMELGKSDKSKDRRPKDDDVDISPSSDDG